MGIANQNKHNQTRAPNHNQMPDLGLIYLRLCLNDKLVGGRDVGEAYNRRFYRIGEAEPTGRVLSDVSSRPSVSIQ